MALAETYLVMPEYYVTSAEESLPQARSALDRALAINPDSARALAVSGIIKGNYEFNWTDANADLQRAVALAPDNATIRQWYGEVLNTQRRVDEALQQLKIARKADPMSVVIRHVPGYMLLWALRFDEAEIHYQDVLDLGGIPIRWTYQNLDILNTLKGDYAEARRRARQLAENGRL